MHVQRLLRLRRNRVDDRESEGNVRHEGAVHHVEVEDIRMRVDQRHIPREVQEIGGEHRWSDQCHRPELFAEMADHIVQQRDELVERREFQLLAWRVNAAERWTEGNHIQIRELLQE